MSEQLHFHLDVIYKFMSSRHLDDWRGLIVSPSFQEDIEL